MVAGIFVASKVLVGQPEATAATAALDPIETETEPPAPFVPEWPPVVLKVGGVIEQFPNVIPVTTEQAATFGWVKAEEDCNPYLGEAYLYGGVRSIDSSATLYFTPDVGGVPGILSGIEVDYYGHYEESMLGTYFSEERSSADGTFHSLAVALRDYDEHDVCDTSGPIPHTGLERVTIAPGLASDNVPLTESSEELQANWKEGSCIYAMGYHYSKDIVGGKELTYESSNLMPVTPMYSSSTGELASIFFVATDLKQTWPDHCPVDPMDQSQPCAAPFLNFWDRSPGLTELNRPPFYMCSNFCDENCRFTGSPDEMFTTMHWMFGNTFGENCGGNPFPVSCRNGAQVEFEELFPPDFLP